METGVFVSDLICCLFESFALQNVQAFSKYKVTNVMYTLS